MCRYNLYRRKGRPPGFQVKRHHGWYFGEEKDVFARVPSFFVGDMKSKAYALPRRIFPEKQKGFREETPLRRREMWCTKKERKEGLRIDSSTIGMESARTYQSTKTTYRRFSLTEYRGGFMTGEGNALNAAVTGGQEDKTLTGENGEATESAEKKLYTPEDWQNGLNLRTRRVNIRSTSSESTMLEFRQLTVRYIFSLFFPNKWGKTDDLLKEWGLGDTSAGDMTTAANNAQVVSGQETLASFGGTVRVLDYVQETSFYEQESTSFSTVGTVKTADGREIRFNVEVGMSRQFQETFREELNVASFTMCDPLVLNLDTDVAELSDQKFFFDIDADGEKDEISMLDAASGYLALDKNGDGTINDGNELFGTKSGDGFADLQAYDEDGNGWIDENDNIWSKLQIWCKDENGKDVLYRLADKGVGAICLQKASTDFALKGAQGQTNGAIRSTGIFLYENGNVGTVQHVDVAKYEQGA